jgi:hypothetical protein
MIKTPKSLVYNLFQIYSYATGKVKHYWTGKSKHAIRIFTELIKWWINERDFNTMYYAMGLNLKGTKIKDFIGRREFLRIKDKIETHLKDRYGCSNLNYDVVCKDKFVAGSFFKSNSIPCAKTIALIKGSSFQQENEKPAGLESLLNNNGRFILKHITLESGEGTYVLEVQNGEVLIDGKPSDLDQLSAVLRNGIWLLQDFMLSHEAIRKINSTALNTTRIVTILDGHEPQYLAGFQAFATKGECTDSWSCGSIYVGIDIDNECLLEQGFYNLSVTGKSIATEHPDSGSCFMGYHLPYLKDAVELCKKAHNLLYFNFIIGWDVAITDVGPVIIEANEKPGINVMQCFDGGVRKRIVTAAENILNNKQTLRHYG